MHEILANGEDVADPVLKPKAPKQPWFWPQLRPLVERFGNDFFRHVPAAPGVYLFCGPDAGVLYVGKAGNLRRRPASHRIAHADRLPRRMVRLLHQVTRIEWNICASERAARHREALLICVLNPKHNRAGRVWPSPTAWREWRPPVNQTETVRATDGSTADRLCQAL